MCFSAANTANKKDYRKLQENFVAQYEEYDKDERPALFCVSGFDHPEMPVITADKKIINKTWGLIPHWAKDWDSAKDLRNMTLNAQSETIDSKPSFKTAVAEQRFCIVPLTGFFEWHTHHDKKKYPFFIYPNQDTFFYVAGLYDTWLHPQTKQAYHSFTLCTTEANERMAWIHNTKKRMPCLLTLEDSKLWLDKGINFSEKQKLLRPASPELHRDHSISKLINDTAEHKNQAHVTLPFTYPELSFGTLFD